ncbi:hypothetical protein DICVIV_09573 [Dictyocaulus viviparus]|uniref:Uncharacterized protein n=1 Tax=Dictyocaulus viviparus TaxID=29172 RepID=A0A0D8XKX1_DICVI|nr:hypothetical protein DICVIV_09573 [Dictyocaulus viviparus]
MPKQDKAILEDLISAVGRLKIVEAQMHRMRKECEDRKKIWVAVEREVNELEEKAVIYRYRVMETQSLHDDIEKD